AAAGSALGPALRVLLRRSVAALLAAALVTTIRLASPLAATLLVAGTPTWAGVLGGHEGHRHKSAAGMHAGCARRASAGAPSAVRAAARGVRREHVLC